MDDLDQKIVTIYCLGSANDNTRWLHGNRDDNSVSMANFLPRLGKSVDLTGTMWKAIKVDAATNAYRFESLYNSQSNYSEFLDYNDTGKVELDEDEDDSSTWILEEGNTDLYYPVYPWRADNTGSGSSIFTFKLKNQFAEEQGLSPYLNGNTGNGGLSMISEEDSNSNSYTGANWLISILASSGTTT